MKKFGLLALVLSLMVPAARAQFYFRAGLGYAFPQAGQTYDGNANPFNGTLTKNSATTNYSVKNASFSSGVQSAVGFGYLINDHVGIQLDATIGLACHKYTGTLNNIDIGGGVIGNVSIIQQAKTPFIINPSMVLQTGGNPWNVYSRFGLALPISTRMSQDEIFSNAPSAINPLTIDDLNFQIKNSFSLGFTAALGVQYKFNDVFSVWGEVSLLSMSAYIKEADLKSWNENGQNVPLSYYGAPLNVKYSKNVVVVDSVLATQPAYSQPFSNVGFNFGISIRLSEKRSHGRNDDIDDNRNFKRRKF